MLIQIKIRIKGGNIKATVDSGASKNIIIKNLVTERGLRDHEKKRLYKFIAANGKFI